MNTCPLGKDKVSCISIHYIKPIVTTTEYVILNYYINESFVELPMVSISISNRITLNIPKVRAGYNSINLGRFSNPGEQFFSISSRDYYGNKSHEVFGSFLVKNELLIKEYIMTTEDLLEYNIDNSDNIDKVSTNRDGLQKLLDAKSSQGFDKFKLLPGIYRMDYLGTLYIPSNFTLDMNKSTIKLDAFSGNKALIIELKDTFDSHIINGTIEVSYTKDDDSKINCESFDKIRITGESKYSSFENLVIKDTTSISINPFALNEVPYISTYYIKPIVTTNENVRLNYYISDFYNKEYLNEDTSETFTVKVNINGYPRIIKENVPAGDNYINLGKFCDLGEHKFSILCTDKYGRNSHELFNFLLVKNELIKEYIMTTEDLVEYNIDNTNNKNNASTNRDGLQQLFYSKNSEGFNKLKLLPGVYRVDHLGTLHIPSNFTLDMNKSTIKLDEFHGYKGLIIELKNTFDSHVINGTIEGDLFNHDYFHSENNSELVNGIGITGKSKYSSFEDLIVKDITGCGAISGLNNSLDDYNYLSDKAITKTFKFGDIYRIAGIDISSTNRATCDFIDISNYPEIEYLSISKYLGSPDNIFESFNLICHFYDINKSFIKSTDAYQYRRIEIPPTSKFIRVTLLTLTPTTPSSYPIDLCIQLFEIPTHCCFKNIKFDNCRCGGMSQGAMNNMLVENCEFSNCVQTCFSFAYTAQHGLDMMQDVTFKGLNFHDNSNDDFYACAGHNFIVDGQVAGNISVLKRARALVIINCKNTGINLQGGDISTIINHEVYRIYNNEFTGGTVANNLSKNIKCTGSLGGVVSDSTLGRISK